MPTILFDDLDGSRADVSVAFVVNGDSYSLNLSQANANRFYAAIRPFIEAATKRPPAPPSTSQDKMAQAQYRAEIRRWANANGYQVTGRGRIPQEVLEAFTKAHPRVPGRNLS